MINHIVLAIITAGVFIIVRKYWAEKGQRILNLVFAIGFLFVAVMIASDLWQLIFGLGGLICLWQARPRTALAQSKVLGQKR